MKLTLENSGMTVEAAYSEAEVNGVFLPLLRRLTELQRAKQGRVLALLAAPPASGKSTLAAFLQQLSVAVPGLCPLTAVGMDGFHRPQAYLLSHTVERDGRILPMASVKGAPVTFDLPRLREALARVAAGERCGWPRYDRTLHEPVPDAVRVEGNLVLAEGNYLLLDEEGWRELREMADYTVGISAPPGILRRRLLARHIAGGMTPEEAEAKVERSDMANIRLCLRRTLPADLQLELRGDGSLAGPGA